MQSIKMNTLETMIDYLNDDHITELEKIDHIKTLINYDLSIKSLKAANQLSTFKGLKTFIAANIRKDSRAMTQGYWIDDQGCQCVCNGYIGMRIFKPVIHNDLQTSQGFDVSKIINDLCKDLEIDQKGFAPLEISYAKVYELVKLAKATTEKYHSPKSTDPKMHKFHDDGNTYNINLVHTAMKTIGATEYIIYDSTEVMKGMYIWSLLGDAIVLPIHTKS